MCLVTASSKKINQISLDGLLVIPGVILRNTKKTFASCLLISYFFQFNSFKLEEKTQFDLTLTYFEKQVNLPMGETSAMIVSDSHHIPTKKWVQSNTYISFSGHNIIIKFPLVCSVHVLCNDL